MINDQGLDLSGLEEVKDEPSQEGSYEKSLSIIQDAMKDIKQEILITLEDGSNHIVYVTGLKLAEEYGHVEVEFNTPSEDRKSELYMHVENCIKIQIQNYFENLRKKRSKW